MKLTIEIEEESHIESYLSIVSIGILECLRRGRIDCHEAMTLLYEPGYIDMFEPIMPNLGHAIHLGTELEDVESIIPDKMDWSIDQIYELNLSSVRLNKRKQPGKPSIQYTVNPENPTTPMRYTLELDG